jgi:hypothetical protein
MDTEESREELWYRLDNETPRAFEAFKIFKYLPPAERTIVAAWRLWSDNPAAGRESPFFLRWSHDYAWSERARAHDHHLEVIRESGMEEAIREEAARQARAVEQVRRRFHELMAVSYERAIQYLEGADFIKRMRPADVVQILKLHLETVHKLAGSETDAAGGSATVDWSEDEQRELDAILDEIDAEESHEDRNAGSDGGAVGPEDSEGVSD